jgi:sulfate adenylyltransferase subunit 2
MRSLGRARQLGVAAIGTAGIVLAAFQAEIITEMRIATTSERQGRLIDHDEVGSMEMKKREGYF